MRVVIVARDDLGLVELFDLALEHGATAIIDLHERPFPVMPPVLKPIYQHPLPWPAENFLKRFARQWSCSAVCQAQRAARCDCEYALLLLVADGHAAEARELMHRVKPYAQVSEVDKVGATPCRLAVDLSNAPE